MPGGHLPNIGNAVAFFPENVCCDRYDAVRPRQNPHLELRNRQLPIDPPWFLPPWALPIPMSLSADPLARIVRWIHEADGLIVAAGAGMGVDSGLPDFRGSAGFWRAYPALGRAGLQFEEIANPAAFARDPPLAWGFYGHRLALYRRTVPHRGFALLREIAAGLPGGAFVFTSNVDGQFQKAGFAEARIMEVHGSIHHLQCQRGSPCRGLVCWGFRAAGGPGGLQAARRAPVLPALRRHRAAQHPDVRRLGGGFRRARRRRRRRSSPGSGRMR